VPRIVDAPAFPATHRWPVSVRYGRLTLAPFRLSDMGEVNAVRMVNAAWLSPWDATSPTMSEQTITATERVRRTWADARRGASLPWLMRFTGDDGSRPVIGQCTVSSIVYGSVQQGSVGYWIDRRWAGRGLMPVAVALATDYAMITMGLHRIEICIRGENRPSLRVVEKLGFRYEGRRARFVHIAGAWRDHEVFALTAEDLPNGLLSRVPGAVVA